MIPWTSKSMSCPLVRVHAGACTFYAPLKNVATYAATP